MGQDRKIRESRDQIELIDPPPAPIDTAGPARATLGDYDFKAEIARDAANERRLMWAELLVIGGIALFVILRTIILARI